MKQQQQVLLANWKEIKKAKNRKHGINMESNNAHKIGWKENKIHTIHPTMYVSKQQQDGWPKKNKT